MTVGCGTCTSPHHVRNMLTLADKSTLAIVCERVSAAGRTKITVQNDRPRAYYSLIASMLGVDTSESGLQFASTKCFEVARCAPLCPLPGGANPTLTIYKEIWQVGSWLWKRVDNESPVMLIYHPLFGVDTENNKRWELLRDKSNFFVCFAWKPIETRLTHALKYQATSGVCVVKIDETYAYCAVVRALHRLAIDCEFHEQLI